MYSHNLKAFLQAILAAEARPEVVHPTFTGRFMVLSNPII